MFDRFYLAVGIIYTNACGFDAIPPRGAKVLPVVAVVNQGLKRPPEAGMQAQAIAELFEKPKPNAAGGLNEARRDQRSRRAGLFAM
jgi:hypothetical protein